MLSFLLLPWPVEQELHLPLSSGLFGFSIKATVLPKSPNGSDASSVHCAYGVPSWESVCVGIGASRGARRKCLNPSRAFS